MPPRENSIVVTTQKKLEREFGHEIWIRKKHGTAFGVAGDPDLYGCFKGRFFGIEMKRPGESATKLQVERLSRLSVSGGIAGVAHSHDEARSILTGEGRLGAGVVFVHVGDGRVKPLNGKLDE